MADVELISESFLSFLKRRREAIPGRRAADQNGAL
jgi:hypothetical protein